MLRRLAALGASTLVAATMAIGSTAPTAHAASACVGGGSAHTSSPINLAGTPAGTTFSFGIFAAACTGANLAASGTVNTGSTCITGGGSGTYNGSRAFTYSNVGAILVATGSGSNSLAGVAVIVPTAGSHLDCTGLVLDSGPQDFTLVGAATWE